MARDTSKYRDSAGKRLPSVTEVLHIAGLVSYGNADPGLVELARQRGEEVDAWITLLELDEIGPNDDPPDGIAGYVAGWNGFIRSTGFKSRKVQRSFVCQRHGFAGTTDIEGDMPPRGDSAVERNALLEIKCTAAHEPWHPVQTGGYILGLESLGLIDEAKPLLRAVVLLSPDGKARLFEHKNHQLDKARFLAALTIAKLRLEWGFAELEG